eukprot:g242.t1
MDAFSQTVSAFLDLADDSDTELLDSSTGVNSCSVIEASDWKSYPIAAAAAATDLNKKRHRPKTEPANEFSVSWTTLKHEPNGIQDAQLNIVELLSKELKYRSKRHCKCTPQEYPKRLNNQSLFEVEGMHFSTASLVADEDYDENISDEMEYLYGCPKCRFRWTGCDKCKKEDPMVSRPKLRWSPANGHPQSVPAAPVYYPSTEEFQDPLLYISQIRSTAQSFGICAVVPPEQWTSSFNPQTDCKGGEEGEFYPKKQLVSSLCVRDGDIQNSSGSERYTKSKDVSPDSSTSEEFGFSASEMSFSVNAFKAFADWSHKLHFSGAKTPPKLISINQIEGEFWRIVEGGAKDDFETFYGSDLDSRRFRKTMKSNPKGHQDWEVSRWPNSPHSLLRQIPGDDPITGVMVPWIYFGSSLSAFCWHVEDHALYSVNYLHTGASKIWYGVPSSAANDFELAMQDALPHLFDADPQLLHRLVTHLSPKQLQQRGIPVYRIEQKPGMFVVTFPNSYHGGFNSGWNCAEAVNFAPADWLPHGTDVLKKYKRQKKPSTFSHDALLINLVSSIQTSSRTHELKTQSVDPLTLKYAVGELSLMIREEEIRREIAFQEGISEVKQMEGCPKSRDENGLVKNTEEMDCELCKCDLFLSAVVSPQKPDIFVCPEHASSLPPPRVLIYRYEISKMHEMVKGALKMYPDCGEFIARAFHRINTRMTSCFVPHGPFYDSSELS